MMAIVSSASSAFKATCVWVLVATFLALYGFHVTDESDFRLIAADPFHVGLPLDHQFLYESPLTFFIGNYYEHHGLTPDATFLVVHALGGLLFVVSLHWAFAATLQRRAYPFALLVLFTSPLLLVLASFVGKSDTFLLGFFFLMTMTDSRFSQSLLAAAMVLCHSQLGAAIAVAYVLLQPERWRPLLIGVVVGEGLVFTYTHMMVSPVPAGRGTYAFAHAAELWRIFAHHPILHIVGALGPFWIYVFSSQPFRWAFVAVFLLALAVSMSAVDFTRDFVLVSTPVIVEIAKRAAVEIATRRGVLIAGRYVGIHVLWPLMFVQFQLAGPKLFWARGTEWVFR